MRRARLLVSAAAVAIFAAASTAFAQRFFSDGTGYEPPTHNIPYDGKFTFARIRYTVGPGGYYYYGMPAWARDGKVCVFMQPASKFKVRYCTIGFDPISNLDDGDMWPTSFAILKIGPAEERKITALVKKAVS